MLLKSKLIMEKAAYVNTILYRPEPFVDIKITQYIYIQSVNEHVDKK